MSAKKIYPKEMFGTPEVNILNDNVLSSVDYNYNVVDSQYREVATFSFSDLVEDYEDAKSYSNANNEVLYDGRKANYDLKIDRLYADKIVKTITKDAGSTQSGQIWASPLFYILKMEYYVDRPLDFNKFRVSYSIEDKVAKARNPISDNSQNVLTLRSQSSDSVISDSAIQYFSSENEVISYYDNYVLEAPLFGMPPCIIATDNKVVLYFALHYYSLNNYFTTTYDSYSYIVKSVNIRLANKCLEVSPISVDTNSQLVLQGNELIQEGTHFPSIPAVVDYVPHNASQNFTLGTGYSNDYLYLYFNSNTLNNPTEKPYDLWGGLTISARATSTVYGDYNIETVIGIIGEDDRNPYRDEYVRMYIERDPNNTNGLIFNCEVFDTTTNITFSELKLEYTYYTKAVITPEQEQLWKDIIPKEIANEYKNGKSTIRLTAVYDGTNEYPVGDLVIPMKSDTEPILKNVDGTEKQFEVTSSEIVYTGRAIQNLELVEYVEVE